MVDEFNVRSQPQTHEYDVFLPISSSHTHSRFLYEVQEHSDINRMNCINLGTVFGPNFLRPRVYNIIYACMQITCA